MKALVSNRGREYPIQQVYDYALECDIELPRFETVQFKLSNRMTACAGKMGYTTGSRPSITISSYLFDKMNKEMFKKNIYDTLCHELGHLNQWYLNKQLGHNDYFYSLMRQMDVRDTRCHNYHEQLGLDRVSKEVSVSEIISDFIIGERVTYNNQAWYVAVINVKKQLVKIRRAHKYKVVSFSDIEK